MINIINNRPYCVLYYNIITISLFYIIFSYNFISMQFKIDPYMDLKDPDPVLKKEKSKSHHGKKE